MSGTERGEVVRYFFDTEFIEDGETIDLISIGIVCEDGREFYGENADADLSQGSEWVWANVIPHLQMVKSDPDPVIWPKAQLARLVVEFVAEGEGTPQFWAYYADYDWVALCQLFGTMMDLPDGWPMFCMDIKQEAAHLGDPPLPEQTSTEHHALADARWNAEAHAALAAALVEHAKTLRADDADHCTSTDPTHALDHEAVKALRAEVAALRTEREEAVRLLRQHHRGLYHDLPDAVAPAECPTCAFLARTDTGGQE